MTRSTVPRRGPTYPRKQGSSDCPLTPAPEYPHPASNCEIIACNPTELREVHPWQTHPSCMSASTATSSRAVRPSSRILASARRVCGRLARVGPSPAVQDPRRGSLARVDADEASRRAAWTPRVAWVAQDELGQPCHSLPRRPYLVRTGCHGRWVGINKSARQEDRLL